MIGHKIIIGRPPKIFYKFSQDNWSGIAILSRIQVIVGWTAYDLIQNQQLEPAYNILKPNYNKHMAYRFLAKHDS